MKLNPSNKISRLKFLSYSLLTGAAVFVMSKIPFIKTSSTMQDNKVVLKINPLSVPREKSGEQNV
jgi:hypothetical protein